MSKRILLLLFIAAFAYGQENARTVQRNWRPVSAHSAGQQRHLPGQGRYCPQGDDRRRLQTTKTDDGFGRCRLNLTRPVSTTIRLWWTASPPPIRETRRSSVRYGRAAESKYPARIRTSSRSKSPTRRDAHQWYFSKADKWRRIFVYTPPDYDKKPSARFPVLYLQHGMGEDESGWSNQGHENFILDNLIAAGKAKPMIVVNEHGTVPDPRRLWPTHEGGCSIIHSPNLTAWSARISSR